MPEYLAPGVYVEEVSFRSKSIEGVSTTTTGFIGPARYGPLDLEPDIITSLGEFKRVYGDGQQLRFGASGSPMHNYLWHAVRAFFEEGGKRLYVVRVFRPRGGSDGIAGDDIGAGANRITVRARFPGSAGNTRVRLTLRLGQSILGGETSNPSTSPTSRVRSPSEARRAAALSIEPSRFLTPARKPRRGDLFLRPVEP